MQPLRISVCFTSLCRIAFVSDCGYPQNRTTFAGESSMIAFFLSLASLGAAGAVLIRGLAVAQARQRAALRPVRAQAELRGTHRHARRE
jgi:hypothetical protein